KEADPEAPLVNHAADFKEVAYSAMKIANGLESNRHSTALAEKLLEKGRALDSSITTIGETVKTTPEADNALKTQFTKTDKAVEELLTELEKAYGTRLESHVEEVAEIPAPVDDKEVMERAENLDNQSPADLYETAVEL